MAHFETVVHTSADRADAFRYLRDFRNAADWDPFVARVDRQEVGAIREGSGFRVEMKAPPGMPALTFDYALTRSERNACIEFVAEGERFRSHDTITFEDREDGEGGCTIRYDADLRPRGAFYLFDLPVHLAFQVSGRGSVAGLRRALETLAKDEDA